MVSAWSCRLEHCSAQGAFTNIACVTRLNLTECRDTSPAAEHMAAAISRSLITTLRA